MNRNTFSKEEQEQIISYFSAYPAKVFSKNEIIVQPYSVYRNVYFIEKGITRLFYYNSKGEEITHWFTLENEVITVLSSVFDKTKTPYGFHALENDTVIRIVPFEGFMEVKNSSTEVAAIFEKMLVASAIQIANRLIAIQTQTAKERYEQLLKHRPEIFQRANLGHIASYLGMARQSLSRIRGMK